MLYFVLLVILWNLYLEYRLHKVVQNQTGLLDVIEKQTIILLSYFCEKEQENESSS